MQGLCARFLLLTAAVGVAPPAVLPPPSRPAALPAGAVASQLSGASAGNAAATVANTVSSDQLGAHLRGQASFVPTDASLTKTVDGSIMEPSSSTSLTDAAAREPQFRHQQSLEEPTPAIDRANSLGAFMLATLAGALSGGLLWRRRASRMQNRELATEMPKVAVAAFAGETLPCKGSERGRTSMQYTTQTILPSLQWCKTGFKGSDLQNGELRTVCLAGCDICVGKTESGQLFAVGDKSPPTGLSFGVGGEVKGDKILEAQYGNLFDVKTGQPVGDWCPSPPIIGPLVGAFMGERQAVAVFEVQQSFFGGEVEVLCDTNAKKAYEADYWKGILDAQGKDDGSYY